MEAEKKNNICHEIWGVRDFVTQAPVSFAGPYWILVEY